MHFRPDGAWCASAFHLPLLIVIPQRARSARGQVVTGVCCKFFFSFDGALHCSFAFFLSPFLIAHSSRYKVRSTLPSMQRGFVQSLSLDLHFVRLTRIIHTPFRPDGAREPVRLGVRS
ncbi:hypothetical protein DFH06DRAFT_1222346 [Mycena polygramma]|nr:hypothetical protein DFH06DRAFT_1222346 [Mycena polygramma]